MQYQNYKKLIWRHLLRQVGALCLIIAFITNSVLPAFTISKNTFNASSTNLSNLEKSYLAYAYDSIVKNETPTHNDLISLANEVQKNYKHITPEYSKAVLEQNLKNDLHTKAKVIQKAYKEIYNSNLPVGSALTLSSSLLANNNSYQTIAESLKENDSKLKYFIPHDTLVASTDGYIEPSLEENSCSAVNLNLVDFYMASPQIKIKRDNPFQTVALSNLSSNQSLFSDLDHSNLNNKLAWNLLGYPVSFGLTYNNDGRFINITTSKSAIQNVIGVASDAIVSGGDVVLGGYLPYVNFNIGSNEYYTVGGNPKEQDDRPYLYGFDILTDQGTFSRSGETFSNHYYGFSNGLDITPNGLLLLGIESGNLTGAWKTQAAPPISIKSISQIPLITKDYTNYFEVDSSTSKENNQIAIGLAGHVLSDTYKQTDIINTLSGTNVSNKNYGFTLVAVNQDGADKNNFELLSKLDIWGDELEDFIGLKNITVTGYKIKNNNLYVSYFINNGVDFKKFFLENYPKYLQQGSSWIDPVSGLPPSAFNYEDGLFDSRLAIYKIDLIDNNIHLQNIADISTVFDSPTCSGNSYGISGPIEVVGNNIFVADKVWSNTIRVFSFNPNSALGITTVSKPFVINLANPRIERVIGESDSKPLGNSFALTSAISDITVAPNQSVLFASIPYLESTGSNVNDIHINGFLASIYLNGVNENCNELISTESCDGITTGDDSDDKSQEDKDASEAQDSTGIERETRFLSILDGPVTPTLSLKIKVDPTQFNPPEYNRGFQVVDLNVPKDASKEDIRVVVGSRGTNYTSVVEINPSDPGDLFFPLLKKEMVFFSDSANFISREGLNARGKSAVAISKGKSLAAVTRDKKVYSGDFKDVSILSHTFEGENWNPTLASSVPNSESAFAVLSTPPDGLQAEPDNLVYYFTDMSVQPATINEIRGTPDNRNTGMNDYSISIPGVFGVPYNLKYKNNNFTISNIPSSKNPDEYLSLSFYRHNLKSKSISGNLNYVLSQIPDFLESSNTNLNDLLKSHQGFSLFTTPNETSVKSGTATTNKRAFTNFYGDNLPAQLKNDPSKPGTNRFITGATFFEDPLSMNVYLAVSSFETDVAGQVFTQEDPEEKKKDSTSQKGVASEGLIVSFDAKNVDGFGKSAAVAKPSIWTDLTMSGFNGALINFSLEKAWVGTGGTKDPYALQFDGIDDNVSINATALDSIRTTNSYTIESIFNLEPESLTPDKKSSKQRSLGHLLAKTLSVDAIERKYSIFSRGTEQRIYIDSEYNIIIQTSKNDISNTNTKITPGSWYHIALTKTSTNITKVYLDGKAIWTDKKSDVSDKPQSALLGAGETSNSDLFRGKIALVRIYDTALNEISISNNYTTEQPRFSKQASQGDKQTILVNCGIKVTTSQGEFISLSQSGNKAFRIPLNNLENLECKEYIDGVSLSCKSFDNYLFSKEQIKLAQSSTTGGGGSTTSTTGGDYNEEPSPSLPPPPPTMVSTSTSSSSSSSGSMASSSGSTTTITPISLKPGTSNFSISIFAQIILEGTTDLGKGTVIFTDSGDGSKDSLTLLTIDGAAAIVHESNSTVIGAVGTSNIVDGKFHHIVGIRTGTTYKIYVDGVLEGTNNFGDKGDFETSTVNFNSGAPFLIGKHDEWGSTLGTFEISQLKLYKKELTDSEIKQEASNSAAVPSSAISNLTFWWKFNEASHNPIIGYSLDNKGNIVQNSNLTAFYYGAQFNNCSNTAGTLSTTSSKDTKTTKSDKKETVTPTVKINDPTVAERYFVGQAIVIALSATNTAANPVTIKGANLPTWATLDVNPDAQAGTLFGTPKEAGTFFITISAEDSKGNKAENKTITIVVNEVVKGGPNIAPSITSPGDKTVTEDKPFSFNIPATDPNGDPMRWTISGIPGEGDMAYYQSSDNEPNGFGIIVNKSTGVISSQGIKNIAKAKNMTVNIFPITASVADNKGGMSEQIKFNFTVVNSNKAPTVPTLVDQEFKEKDFTFTLPAATDPDGDATTYKITNIGIPAQDKSQIEFAMGFGGAGFFDPFGSTTGGFDPFGFGSGCLGMGGFGSDYGFDEFGGTPDPGGLFSTNFDIQDNSFSEQCGKDGMSMDSFGGAGGGGYGYDDGSGYYDPSGGYYRKDNLNNQEKSKKKKIKQIAIRKPSTKIETIPTTPQKVLKTQCYYDDGGYEYCEDFYAYDEDFSSPENILKALGITFDSKLGKFTGTLEALILFKKSQYVIPITVVATDGKYNGDSESKLFNIKLVGGNQPPIIVNPGDKNANDNEPFSIKIQASDPNNDPITCEIIGLPSMDCFEDPFGITYDKNTCTITGNPMGVLSKVNQSQYTIPVTANANDGKPYSNKSDLASFNINIVDTNNQLPIIEEMPTVEITEGIPVSVMLKASDPNSSDKLTYYLKGLPNEQYGLKFDSMTGTISGTVSGLAKYCGRDEVTYKIGAYVGDGHFDSYSRLIKFELKIKKASAYNPTNENYKYAFSMSLRAEGTEAWQSQTLQSDLDRDYGACPEHSEWSPCNDISFSTNLQIAIDQ